jgi:serine/threonine protein kinase
VPDTSRAVGHCGDRGCFGLFVEELLYSGPVFEATGQAVRTQIFQKLGTKNSTIVQMKREGGMNEGMWILSGASGNFILKLVQHERRHPLMQTEAEQFVKLSRDHPAVAEDPCLAFPLKIFHCRDQTRDRIAYDLITMRKAPGGNFSDIIGKRWFLNQKAELMQDMRILGRFLAEVHGRHNMQHGDFTPSNVFYDEASGTFTLVDVADFGQQSFGIEENDVERFTKGISMMAKCYGEVFYSEGKKNFLAGYNERQAILKQ